MSQEICVWVNGVKQAPDDRWRQEYWLHWTAAVSEGLCPFHYDPLEPVVMPPRRIAGHCQPCRKFWGLNLDDGEAGWWLDYDPRWPERFSVPVPDWMEAG